MHPSNGLIERIETHWRELLAALEGIPEEHLLAPGAVGTWSVKDLLGHIAYWDGEATARVRRIMAGKSPELPEDSSWEVHSVEAVAQRADWSLERAWSNLHETHAAMLATLQAAREAGTVIPPGVIDNCTYNHYAEHIADLHAYRERLGR